MTEDKRNGEVMEKIKPYFQTDNKYTTSKRKYAMIKQ